MKKKNTETLIDASKEVSREVIAERAMYMYKYLTRMESK
jgi:hypothetical protein